MEEQKVIEVNNLETANNILMKYIELGQQKGVFGLAEAELIKRSSDVIFNNVTDPDISQVAAYNLFIQAVNKSQRAGAYTLNDAALLHKTILFVASLFGPPPGQQVQQPASVQQQPASVQQQQASVQQQPAAPQMHIQKKTKSNDEILDLAEPIPLKPRVI